MRTRREARELGVQALYQLETRADEDQQAILATFWAHFAPDGESSGFERELVDGVLANKERIDALIAEAAQHWRLGRLSRVDLGVLRLATFELLGRPDIPAAVTIDEAIDIARRFGGPESASFVNGVLDAIATRLDVKSGDKPQAVE